MEGSEFRIKENYSAVEGKELDGSEKEFLAESKIVGQAYVGLVDRLVNGQDLSIDLKYLPSEARPFFDKIIAATQNHQDKFDRIKTEEGISAAKLLAQAKQSTLDFYSLENSGRIRLEEFSPGIYGVIIDEEIYREIFGDHKAQAKAAKVNNGVSFVVLPNYGENEIDNLIRTENIPHEVNHLISFFVEQENLAVSDEDNEEVRKNFLLWREEILCRLCSGGVIGGYDHVRVGAKKREKLAKDDPNILNQLDEYSATLTKICEKISNTHRSSQMSDQDSIWAVLKSKNYNELIQNLKFVSKIMEKTQSESKDDKNKGGWSFA
jgi:hypothetical protein